MKEIYFYFYDRFNELALLHNHKDMNIDIQQLQLTCLQQCTQGV